MNARKERSKATGHKPEDVYIDTQMDLEQKWRGPSRL